MAAEFVGGAVFSAFLQVAFDRVTPDDVVNFLKGNKRIGGLVEKLKIVMISADSVLSDAEEKQFEYPNVKRWLDELKDAVYVADDLLDEIATEALRSKSEAEIQTFTSKVRGIFSYSVSSFDKRIQSELEKILDRLEYIIKQKDTLGLVACVALKGTPGLKVVQSRPLTTSYPEEYVFGRDKNKEAIFERFQSNGASDDEICVVPIVGMGGVGKTTLARFVFNDKRVEESFDLKAWVCVSENFDSDRIVKTILEAISNDQNMNLPQNKLREKFIGKKIFLVLDDFWNEDYCDWDELRRVFKCGAKEIKIIVTTRSEIVASIVRTAEAFSLEQLSDEECWLLFEKHAFINGKAGEFPILEDIGRQIVQKCKGLPLAAKTLGGLLRCKQDPKEWRMILKSDIWNLPKEKSSILPALRLSYHYLPSHLKHCFAYCSILPKDYEFKKEELVLLWMAQDFLQQSQGNDRMEEIGERYFDDLVSRSLFQRSSINESCFIMHDLVNDLATFISGEFCFRLEEDDELKKITKKIRHFSFYEGGFDDSKKFEILSEAKGLRTFLGELECSWEKHDNIWKMICDLLKEFKTLRVLKFSISNIRELPNFVDDLKHLRYLNISDTNINALPDSLCNLYNLHTLILPRYFTKLPANTSKLINLRHLDNSVAKMEEMPPHMDKLKNLRKLPVFVVGEHDDGSSIKELGELQHLSGKLSLLNLENVQCINKDITEVILKNKQDLSELKLKWKRGHGAEDSEKERSLLEQLCPCTDLNSLTITNYEGTSFPKWLGDSSFSKMVSIKLCNCDNCFSLPPLGQLPDLKSLEIVCFGKISSVGPEFYGNTINPFRALEHLSFENMPEWQEWVLFEGEVFTCLRKLYIYNCPKLSGGLPVQLPSLTILLTSEVILENIQDLSELKFEWNGAGDSEKQRILLEQSCPRTDLNSLTITNYEGTSFPKWLGDSSFSKMVSIELRNCDNCFSLPPLGQLPDLKSLEIECFGKISSVGPEFYGNTINPFRALEYLSFKNMPEWQEWVLFKGEVFTCLRELYIKDCPKLIGGLPVQLPSLTELNIRKCKQLVASLPNSPALHGLVCTGKIQIPSGHDYQSLKSVFIEGGGDSILSFPPEFASLTCLDFCGCPNLVSFPSRGLCAPNLSQIAIEECRNLKSLPEGMHTLLPSLVSLVLRSCPKLESFPEGGLPSSLASLSIFNCDKLISRRMELGLQSLHSLRSFSISTHHKELESFPEEALLPPNLTDFYIGYSPYLKSLNGKGFQPLTSLKNLHISDCDNLDCLPLVLILPTSLCELYISDCPLLKEQYENEKGKGRVKIAHIPKISIC